MITRMALALACLQCTACGDEPEFDTYVVVSAAADEEIRFDGMALASWYGDTYAGRLTASGEIFDPHGMTAASVSLPLGTVLEVCRAMAPAWPYGVRCVRVVANDRQPPHENPDRTLDLSYEAARRLGMIEDGIAYVYYREIAP